MHQQIGLHPAQLVPLDLLRTRAGYDDPGRAGLPHVALIVGIAVNCRSRSLMPCGC